MTSEPELREWERRISKLEQQNHDLPTSHAEVHAREREAVASRTSQLEHQQMQSNEWRGAMDDRERNFARKPEVDAEFSRIRDLQTQAERFNRDSLTSLERSLTALINEKSASLEGLTREKAEGLEKALNQRSETVDRHFGGIDRTIANWTGRAAIVSVVTLAIFGPITAIAVKSLLEGLSR